MNYVVEIGLDAVLYIPSFLNIGSGIQKLLEGTLIQRDRHTHREESQFLILLLLVSIGNGV
jgi:hypothetical protein